MSSAAIKRIKKKLPERLAEVRGDRSQRQFARDLGVFQQNVNRYENGTTPHALHERKRLTRLASLR